ncbi:SDR family NAD(P)-dependent oxidoreductase [Schauerella aestuarii]|uniref:SDR family NAD(P)-dependent oxidoreductase n=1 Tax=Schauerella aestuarii TaxID=2511204 RepID=UPI00136ABC19|nr:SDR family oxidoreductase [Achromobacter aestuarii]MYZ41898.1 SDR family oxidoreductase [Achromobacter aestuarii]
MRLASKVALVVGAGTLKNTFSIAGQLGNDAAAAIRFAQEGASVICADRSLAVAQETAQRTCSEGGLAEAIELDATNSGQIDAVSQQVAKSYGGIDVLHTNVGIEIQGDLLEVQDDDWDRLMTVNVRASMATARAFLPLMRSRGAGSISNVSSTASLKWSPMQFLSYSTAKAAVNHMTRVIARQFAAEQVRCNCIIPGMIRTPHADALYPCEAAALEGHKLRDARCPMGRQGSPWDIANAALFLASDE